MLTSLLFLQAQVLKHQDDVRAAQLAQEGLTIARDMGHQDDISFFLCLIADIAQIQGNLRQANEYYRESMSLALRSDSTKEKVGDCLLGLARIARAERRFQSAARLFGAAEIWLTGNMDLEPVERAEYERTVENVRTELGEEAFTAAWAEGRTMTPEQVLAVPEPQVSPTAGGSPSAPSAKLPITYPDRLTAREVEILHLVAQGLTNDQVAEQLVISPRTVNTHLTSIYSKIGVSSRSAATRYAIEHHLV